MFHISSFLEKNTCIGYSEEGNPKHNLNLFIFLGYCNVGHIVGYKIGILFGGGILTALNSHISPKNFFFVISIAYGISAAYCSKSSSQLFKSEGNHEAKSKTGSKEGEILR